MEVFQIKKSLEEHLNIKLLTNVSHQFGEFDFVYIKDNYVLLVDINSNNYRAFSKEVTKMLWFLEELTEMKFFLIEIHMNEQYTSSQNLSVWLIEKLSKEYPERFIYLRSKHNPLDLYQIKQIFNFFYNINS